LIWKKRDRYNLPLAERSQSPFFLRWVGKKKAGHCGLPEKEKMEPETVIVNVDGMSAASMRDRHVGLLCCYIIHSTADFGIALANRPIRQYIYRQTSQKHCES